MKKTIMMCAIALTAFSFVGCTPDAEQINKTSSAIGAAAGLVANQTKITDDARNAVVQILGDVRSCFPAEGQTFAEAWAPLIESKVYDLIASGKLNDSTGAIVKSVAGLVSKAVDYLFNKYPKAKESEELVSAGATGAIDGFLSVFKPVDGERATPDYDKEAYEFFQKNFK